MRLSYLSCPIDADKYNIDEQELEGLPLKDQVQLVADKMQHYHDKKEAAKIECDKKMNKLFLEIKKLKKKRAKLKAEEMQANENRSRLLKEYNDNIDLIQLKIEKAKNE